MKNFFKKLMSSKSQSKYFSETVQRVGKNNAGFSLVELIVVIAIMAILAAVAVIGVSVYIPKAQKAADEQMAADIEKAMNMYAQSGNLTPGDYVIIYFDKDAVCGNSKVDAATTMETLMKDMYGDNWQKELRLAWDGWEAGPASDAEAMENVENSNFKRDEMEGLLTQVQTVVDAFAEFMIGNNIDVNSPNYKYLQMAGIPAGEITAENAQAVGNAAVFGVSEQISNALSSEESKQNFVAAWNEGGDFSSIEGMDAVAQTAAKYAYTLAYAKEADRLTGGTTYTDMLTAGVNEEGADNKTLIINNMNAVIAAVERDSDTNAELLEGMEAYFNGTGTGTTPIQTDALSFLAYMDGVTSTSDAVLESSDLNNRNFFTDGKVLNYVDNYFDASKYLQNAPQGAIVFIYNGTNEIFSAPEWSHD